MLMHQYRRRLSLVFYQLLAIDQQWERKGWQVRFQLLGTIQCWLASYFFCYCGRFCVNYHPVSIFLHQLLAQYRYQWYRLKAFLFQHKLSCWLKKGHKTVPSLMFLYWSWFYFYVEISTFFHIYTLKATTGANLYKLILDNHSKTVVSFIN